MTGCSLCRDGARTLAVPEARPVGQIRSRAESSSQPFDAPMQAPSSRETPKVSRNLQLRAYPIGESPDKKCISSSPS